MSGWLDLLAAWDWCSEGKTDIFFWFFDRKLSILLIFFSNDLWLVFLLGYSCEYYIIYFSCSSIRELSLIGWLLFLCLRPSFYYSYTSYLVNWSPNLLFSLPSSPSPSPSFLTPVWFAFLKLTYLEVLTGLFVMR